jgi:hypothetical protein
MKILNFQFSILNFRPGAHGVTRPASLSDFGFRPSFGFRISDFGLGLLSDFGVSDFGFQIWA